ncbi:BTAD domain-containing putative transcriptional regulator [Nesterenkonia haasae]|uniref:BTAD domain-containing putative transcriptional regulator n=1 Tax=Nesterenkonia haasae TaxID=2587813 RepID=UPI0013915F99|nr:BTAD domain-containing putative transcriptional regulator [Nesterenkonia haasae]NDK30824.1 tetratricopeptide repeat protein [Nesterenkonia haasae]
MLGTPPALEVRLLGALSVASDGTECTVNGRVRRALISVLALRAGSVIETNALIESVWGRDAPATAVNTLRVHISHLRQALTANDVIENVGAGYRLNILKDSVDVFRFEARVRSGREALTNGDAPAALKALRAALEEWRGDPLIDVDCPWAESERARLLHLHAESRVSFAEAELQCAGRSVDVPQLEALVQEAPFDERVWALLIKGYYWSGRQSEALEAYRRAQNVLSEELGIDPGVELQEIHRQVLRHDPRLEPPMPRSRDLPAFATSFHGREQEKREIAELTHHHRLLTLTGLGGVGKTRLAVAAASLAGQRSGRDTVFVGLDTVTDRRLILPTLAKALGAEHPTVESVCAHIGESALLIVVDNCEHLREGIASALGSLLTHCPTITFLATSRVPLNLTGECVWPTPPLQLPHETAEEARSAAVELFLDRAQQSHPQLSPDSEDLKAAETIAKLMGGLPLGIELAAAQCSVLAPAQIADRLATPSPVTLIGQQGRSDRHHSMDAALEGTLDLLPSSATALLGRMTVFRGAVDISAIECVCLGGEVTKDQLVPLLAALVQAAAVTADLSGPTARYSLLPPVRQAARDVIQAPERARTAANHAQHFTKVAQQAAQSAGRADENNQLARMDSLMADVRAALEYAVNHDVNLGLDLIAALGPYWMRRRQHAEGRQWASEVLTRADGSPASSRAAAFHTAGSLAFNDGSRAEAAQYLSAALHLRQELGDSAGTALTLNNLAGVASDSGDHQQAADYWERALKMFAQSDHTVGVASTRLNLGIVHEKLHELEHAQTYLEAALEDIRGLGNRGSEALVLERLSLVSSRCAEPREALAYARAAHLVREESGTAEQRSRSLWQLSMCYRTLGQFEESAAHLAHAAQGVLDHDLVDAWWVPALLETAAALRSASEPHRAAQLLGLASMHRRHTNNASDQATIGDLSVLRAALRQTLTPEGMLEEATVGEALAPESILEELAQLHPPR